MFATALDAPVSAQEPTEVQEPSDASVSLTRDELWSLQRAVRARITTCKTETALYTALLKIENALGQ